MSDDAKEWVTIRIPESVRDAARDDPRTYGDIMQAGLGDTPEKTRGIADALENDEVAIIGSQETITDEIAARLQDTSDGDVDADELAREVSERIDYAQLATQTAEQIANELR